MDQPKRCPRCSGQVFTDANGEIGCLQCGWAAPDPPTAPITLFGLKRGPTRGPMRKD